VICALFHFCVNSSGSGEESIGIDVESQPFIREQKRWVCNISDS